MSPVAFFCLQHGRVHSSKVSSVLSIADQVFSGLTDEQMRARPATGLNSARVEDVGVNLVVTAGQQVLDKGWSSRLGVLRTDAGNGMIEDELTEFARTADIAAIRAYRDAVGRRTRDVVETFEPASWAELISKADAEHVARHIVSRRPPAVSDREYAGQESSCVAAPRREPEWSVPFRGSCGRS